MAESVAVLLSFLLLLGTAVSQNPSPASATGSRSSASPTEVETETAEPTTQEPVVDLCMALEQIASSALQNVTCETNEVCDGLECLVGVFGTGVRFPVLVTVMPCNQPPAIHLAFTEPGGRVIQEQITSRNTTIKVFNFELRVSLRWYSGNSISEPRPGGRLLYQWTISTNTTIKVLSFDFHVRLDQQHNAIGLKVDGVNVQHEPETTEQIIQYTRIPISTTDCPHFVPESNTHPTRLTAMATVATSGSEIQEPSHPTDICLALEQMAISARQSNKTCCTDLSCDGLECMLNPSGPNSPFSVTALILPCLDPPAVQLSLINVDGRSLFDEIVVESSSTEVFGITVIVVLDQLLMEDAIGFQMEIQDPFTSGGEQDIIFPYGKIPIDKSTCPTTTCEALQSVALKSDVASSIKCKTDEVCSGVECLANVFGTGLLFPVLTRVLPCNKPPAVYFLLRHPGEEGEPIIEQTISKNTTIKVFSFEIHIRLDQLGNAIGLRVDGAGADEFPEDVGEPVAERIIEYTRVPIDNTGCTVASGETASHFTSSLLLAAALLLFILQL